MIFRSFFAGALAAAWLCAAPQPLTTIQDTLYKADGTRFNGTLQISWTTFVAIDQSQIMQQTTTVTVVDGNLQVQLVPTTTATPAAYYTVTYNSDGRVQFTETWAVPSSTQPLRVRDVRIATSASVASGDTSTTTTTVQESDVVGLISDLGARPLKGPAYATGRVAWVNPTGSLETVTGSPSDCVRVDGTSGPCGGALPGFTDNEAPAGLVDGANATFVLAAVPNPAESLVVYRNGVLQKAGFDYSLSGNTILFVSGAIPQPGDTLLASYRVPGAGTDTTAQLYPSTQVLCSGLGASTTSATLASVASCVIPGGFLAAGDRLEVRFDFDHQGSAGGYSFEVHWGGTTILHRDPAAGDALTTGRADIGLKVGGAQLSHQSWGTALPFAAGVGTAADDYFTNGITVDFQARAASGDTVTLRSFAVVRVP
jgi:hypothetical protein